MHPPFEPTAEPIFPSALRTSGGVYDFRAALDSRAIRPGRGTPASPVPCGDALPDLAMLHAFRCSNPIAIQSCCYGTGSRRRMSANDESPAWDGNA